jgi:hypothetical protein
MIIQFKKVWRQGGLLCKELGSFQWQIIPNMYYLPKHMANHRLGFFIQPQDNSNKSDFFTMKKEHTKVPHLKVTNLCNWKKRMKR